jgi:hypothetical protein
MDDVIEIAQLLAQEYAIEPKIFEGKQIRIDANNPNGFSFSLNVEGSEYILAFGDWHQPFDKQEEALLAFEKCLSGEAQLRVVTRLNIPYQGSLEIYSNGAERPQVRYVMGSLFVLFLLPFPKREKVYRNSFTRSN